MLSDDGAHALGREEQAALSCVRSPASCLPNLHVAAAFVSAFAVVGERRAPLLVAWAALIWGSTLTTRQHYVVDGVAGLLLALAVWALFYARPKDREQRVRLSSPGCYRGSRRAGS
ncbi:phosphatase PAP2 family protein [Archangium gephyra]|nr:phosphatase PAP2 family protein [Archangium gephyra]